MRKIEEKIFQKVVKKGGLPLITGFNLGKINVPDRIKKDNK